jgi:hypothetical protein
MNIVSKPELQPVAVEATAPEDGPSPAEAPAKAARSRGIKPLLGLVPFVMRYRSGPA